MDFEEIQISPTLIGLLPLNSSHPNQVHIRVFPLVELLIVANEVLLSARFYWENYCTYACVRMRFPLKQNCVECMYTSNPYAATTCSTNLPYHTGDEITTPPLGTLSRSEILYRT